MVKGAVFLGTPHHGSSMSKLAKIEATLSYWAGSRTELLELLTPGSQENQQLNEDYIRAYDQIEHVDFYETKEERLPWLGIKTGVVRTRARHSIFTLILKYPNMSSASTKPRRFCQWENLEFHWQLPTESSTNSLILKIPTI